MLLARATTKERIATLPGMINVVVPDGTSRELERDATALDLAAKVGPRLARDAVAARVNGKLVDLSTSLHDGDVVRIVTGDSDEGTTVLRHSTAHVMAQAVLRLYPGAEFAIGPAIADGFYYDFRLPNDAHFSEDDLARIESEMRRIIAEAQPFTRQALRIEDALKLFDSQPFKREIIEQVAEASGTIDPDLATETDADSSTVTTYRNSDRFIDLCRGPHVPSTGRLGHFKLTRVAGSYWRGDERRPQLQRIYGTAWPSEQALADYALRLAEAERRDHRKLGAELDLFSFPEEIGSGLAVFHPKGGLVRRVMEDYSRQQHERAGYEFVSTPHITKAALFERSGHLDWFAESMFPPMELDGGQQYYLKPMNCPMHILIYRGRQRSYRELPMRLFEFGTVYRYELSGVVHGLTRVRGMTQDDAHIFCTREQMTEELDSLLTFVLDLLRDFGLEDFYLELSTRPEDKSVGTDAEWDDATEVLRTVGERRELDLKLDPGGGSFYGPKISVQARDAIGRTWQMSTIQVDFQLPQRFDLSYVGPDNDRHRPIMIHRALFGSVERFFAVLLEHYAGALPTWLAPVQVRVLPVKDANASYASQVTTRLRDAGVRVELDAASEPLGARVRRGKLEKLPYLLVVGDEDERADSVGLNRRGSDSDERGVGLDRFVAELREEIERRGRPEDGSA